MGEGENGSGKKAHENMPALQEVSGQALSAAMHMGAGFASPFMKDILLKRQRIVGTRYQGGSDELVAELPVKGFRRTQLHAILYL